MIIDIPYIKKVLNTEVSDEGINFLIEHYFKHIVDTLNIDTTLKEQEITDYNEIANDNPNFFLDNLTKFQETLIYGIACNLEQTSNIVFTNEFYEDVLPKIDTSKISYDEDIEKYNITFCDVFNQYLDELNKYLNKTLTPSYVRELLNLDYDDISDEKLDFLINHYIDYYKELMPDVDVNSPKFKYAVWVGVACHIFRTDPFIISYPASYTVDEVKERFGTKGFDKEGRTWCDLADAILSALKKQTYGFYGIRVFDRPGARTTGNWKGPQP